jgi:hypothetical protein
LRHAQGEALHARVDQPLTLLLPWLLLLLLLLLLLP